MAFPTSPSNGDLYNGYRYNSTNDLWRKINNKYVVNTYAPNAGSNGWDLDGISLTQTLPNGWTWDLSGYLPDEAYAVDLYVIAFYNGNSALNSSECVIWNADETYDFHRILGQSINLRISPEVASTAGAKHVGITGSVSISSSKSVKIGKSANWDNGYIVYAAVKGYYI